MYRFLQKHLLDPKDLLLADELAFIHRNASIDIWCICHLLGLTSSLPEADSKDPVVPA
jgi:hypothetical protein